MSASDFTVLNVAKPQILNLSEKLSSDTFAIALVSPTPAFSATYTGSSGSARYSDISASEVTGTGYTAGGANTTVTVSGNATVTVGCTGASWTTATITACYAVVYDRTDANQQILGYVALDPDGGTANVSSTAGTFSVSFASGLFSLA